MNKQKSNPYVKAEKILFGIGFGIVAFIVSASLAVLLIVMPITGIIGGDSFAATWVGWIIVIGAAVLAWVISLLGRVIDLVSEKFIAAKYEWERKNGDS